MEGELALCTDSDPTSTGKLYEMDSKEGLLLTTVLRVC